MKTSLLACIFCLLASLAFGQKDLQTQLSPQHQAIAGTKVSLIPPPGFTKAENFLGLQQTETQSSIMVVSIPGPAAEILNSITPENLARQGVVTSQVETLQINGLPAVWVVATQAVQGVNFGKRILILGNEQETMMLNAAFPENQEDTGKAIEASLMSLVYEPGKTLDPMEALDFRIDVSGTKLKFGRAMGTTLIFTVDGQVPTASPDKTNLIVGKAISDSQPDDRRQFAIDRINQTPIPVESMEYVREVSIAGLPGYEIYARGKDAKTGEPEYLVQVILFTDRSYYILFGTTPDASPESMEAIKKAIGTFRMK